MKTRDIVTTVLTVIMLVGFTAVYNEIEHNADAIVIMMDATEGMQKVTSGMVEAVSGFQTIMSDVLDQTNQFVYYKHLEHNGLKIDDIVSPNCEAIKELSSHESLKGARVIGFDGSRASVRLDCKCGYCVTTVNMSWLRPFDPNEP